jgi:isopentenyl diphosphate isomerase/L-lactate dehydrogenase-like FMN-dependent dehydrogenase
VARPARSRPARIDWRAVDQIRQRLAAPVLVKGIMTTEDAEAALQHGVQGIIVSNHGVAPGPRRATIDVLPSIADAVGGKVPVLVDGSFRRGSDVLKALALGARAVLLARPVIWALAAYGAPGVQTMLELLQTDLGRMMGMCGKPSVQTIDRALVRLHQHALTGPPPARS